MEEFVLTILKESNIYAAAEIHKMQSVLEQLQSQRDVEKRKKYKADSFKTVKNMNQRFLYISPLLTKIGMNR